MKELDILINEHQDGTDLTIEIFEHPEVQKHLNILVYTNSKKYKIPVNELRSIAYEAFLNALRKYDSEKGSKFTTLWSAWFLPCLKDYFKDKSYNGIFKNPQSYINYRKVKKVLEEDPTLSDEEVRQKANIKGLKTVQNMRRLGENISVDEFPDLCGSIEEDFGDEFWKWGDIYLALEELPKKDDMYIIMQRFGLFDTEKKTLAEIAEISGCTAENIRLREKIALKQLRKIMEKQNEPK